MEEATGEPREQAQIGRLQAPRCSGRRSPIRDNYSDQNGNYLSAVVTGVCDLIGEEIIRGN